MWIFKTRGISQINGGHAHEGLQSQSAQSQKVNNQQCQLLVMEFFYVIELPGLSDMFENDDEFSNVKSCVMRMMWGVDTSCTVQCWGKQIIYIWRILLASTSASGCSSPDVYF